MTVLTGLFLMIRPSSVSASSNLVADVSSYQPSSLAFFQKLKQQGVKAVIVKVTQGVWYVNPEAKMQIINAKKAGLLVNAYHYAEFNSARDSGSPAAEAIFFAKESKTLGISTDRVLALDIEDSKNSSNSSVITKDINTFNDTVHSQGYQYTSTYSMRSWFSSNLIQVSKLHDKNLWIAEYGVNAVQFQPCGTWQFTSQWNSGYGNIDMSYDYDGRFTTINKGDLNNFSASQSVIQVKGWHISNEIEGYDYRYLIIMNADTNKEIKRIRVSSVPRTDVQRVYPNVGNSLNSGVLEDVPVDASLSGKRIFVIDRYTSDPSGSKDYIDYWFRPDAVTVPRKTDNLGELEKFTANESKIQMTGWHIGDDTKDHNYRYLIVMDADTNKEIKRVLISGVARPDIYSQYPNVYNSSMGGFNQSIDVDSSLSGKNIFLIDRYTSDPKGSNNYVDYWFRSGTIKVPKRTENVAELEKFSATNSTIQVTGWHASDEAVGRAYRYLILMDADANKEIKRVRVSSIARPDIQSKYPNVYNSLNSGVSTSIPVDSSLEGKRVFVIDRYTSDPSGSKDYTDYWFRSQSINIVMLSV